MDESVGITGQYPLGYAAFAFTEEKYHVRH